tara:strand:- start:275 stop:1189 length:915 start_codon:yes stop_codon:yes gene_type:complete
MATGMYGGNPPWKGKKGIAGIAATMGPGDSRSSGSYSPFNTNPSPNITNYTTGPPRTAPYSFSGRSPLATSRDAAFSILTKMGMSPKAATRLLQVLPMVSPTAGGISGLQGAKSLIETLGGLFNSAVDPLPGSETPSSAPLIDPLADNAPSGEASSESSSGGLSDESIQNWMTQGQLERMSSGIYRAPGGDTSLMGAKGRNAAVRGTNRARQKEQRIYKRTKKAAAAKYEPSYWTENYGLTAEQAADAARRYQEKFPPSYFDDIMKNKNMGIHSVMKDDWDSFADSRGVPYNIDELMAAAGGDG